MNDGEQDGSEGRLRDELSLLEAMYTADLLSFDIKTRVISFSPSPESGARLKLRLPADYPGGSHYPQVVQAYDSSKQDVWKDLDRAISALRRKRPGAEDSEVGESLDQIIETFNELLEARQLDLRYGHDGVTAEESTAGDGVTHKTVIIWLHHLLATSKRKLALHPSALPAGTISGITKPGYPGIMIFSGPSNAVNDHVAELRSQNWQAFSVRYDEEEFWRFENDAGEQHQGIQEVETMAEVVRSIAEGRREVFLKAAGVK